MIDWKKLLPDEPFNSDVEFFPLRPIEGTPPAVKNSYIGRRPDNKAYQ
jgi:hypothetical protein